MVTRLIITALFLSACGILSSDETRVVGRVDLTDPSTTVLTVPDSVQVEVPFTVTVTVALALPSWPSETV